MTINDVRTLIKLNWRILLVKTNFSHSYHTMKTSLHNPLPWLQLTATMTKINSWKTKRVNVMCPTFPRRGWRAEPRVNVRVIYVQQQQSTDRTYCQLQWTLLRIRRPFSVTPMQQTKKLCIVVGVLKRRMGFENSQGKSELTSGRGRVSGARWKTDTASLLFTCGTAGRWGTGTLDGSGQGLVRRPLAANRLISHNKQSREINENSFKFTRWGHHAHTVNSRQQLVRLWVCGAARRGQHLQRPRERWQKSTRLHNLQGGRSLLNLLFLKTSGSQLVAQSTNITAFSAHIVRLFIFI